MQLATNPPTEASGSFTYRTNFSFMSHHRSNLSVSERVNVGLIAAFGNKYGRITRLSK